MALPLIGAVMSAAAGMANNAISERQSQNARMQNFMLNEWAAANADRRARALYQDFQSPEALLRQYKEAGLSPSLMFGAGGGTSGTIPQGAQGEGASGLNTQMFGINALEAAQIGLIKAQERKTDVETENISTNTDKQRAEIDKLVQDTKNAGLIYVWQELQNTLAQMDVNLKGEYAEQQIQAELAKTYAETNNLVAMLRSLKAKGKIDEESADSIIQYTRDRVTLQLAEIALKQSQKRLTDAQVTLTNTQVQKLLNDILVDNANVEISRRAVKVQEDQLNKQVEQWAIENGFKKKDQQIAIAGMVKDAIEGQQNMVVRIIDALIPF